MPQSLQQDLRQLRRLKEDRDRKKKSYETADEAFKRKQQAVFDRMEAEGMGSMVDKRLGVQFVPTETVYGQISDRSEFIEWAKENDISLIQHKEREDLLNQLVRERIDNGEPLPPGVTMRVRQYIGQRAA